MQQLIKILTPLFFIIVYIIFTSLYNRSIELVRGFPIWMKSPSGLYSRQTSGLFFIGREGSKKIFLSANDNGRIDKIYIDDSFTPPQIDVKILHFNVASTAKFFQDFPKLDFEDIVYDRITDKILVSIEGNSGLTDNPAQKLVDFKDNEGVYEFSFNNTILTCDTLKNVRKITMPPEIYKYTNDNLGFEGMAITDNFLFMGLENITDSVGQFTDSTYLYILDRKTNDVKTISSKKLGIRSITALCAQDDYTLYGVDRESKAIFCVKFNPDFSVKDVRSKPFDLPMPMHPDIYMDKISGVEAIALDDEGYIYTNIDPWSDLYKPYFTPKNFLTQEEKDNITKLVPVLYKYKNPFR